MNRCVSAGLDSSVTPVIPERAEEALARTNRALPIYRQQTVHPTPDPGTGQAESSWALTQDFYAQSTILALVSIAEEFCVSRLVELTEERSPRDPIVELLWATELERSADTWPQRDALLVRYFGIAAKDFPGHAALLGFVDARNAIAHGLGKLTRKQVQKRPKISAHLAQAGISLARDVLLLEQGNVERCAAVMKDYVRWLDER